MKRVLAALDNSLAGTPVLAAARALASLLDARAQALHVRMDGVRTARNTAEAAGVPLKTVTGPVVERLVQAGREEEVVALAIGARSTPSGRRPLGGTAAAVATELLKPVIVVPPEAHPPDEFRRVLVPVEASLSASLVPQTILELAPEATIEAVALHVYEEDSLPPFTDQPQHEQAAWAQEFLARYCPARLGSVRLETRVGRSDELVPLVAGECGCDLVALGWAQEFGPGRALVVRGTLERSTLPVLLVPVRLLAHVDDNVAPDAPADSRRPGRNSPIG
jgi:nucleotide-binding universal stress UspA family protein